MLRDLPVVLCVYDLLESGGVDRRAAPQHQRRAWLEALLAAHPQPGLLLSPLLSGDSWADLAIQRDQARARGVEGLMLKQRHAAYGVGRTKDVGTWWKWKIDPYTVDAVLLYAQAGHGRRSTLYTDYTFGVWDGEALVPVAKAYSGLTREEIAVMEDRGCHAEDWTLVQVAQDFDPFRVRRTHLKGRCALGRFGGEVEVMPGMTLGTGIYDCTLVACQVGNDCLIEKVRFAGNLIVERGAVLFDIGAITCSGAARFGCGLQLPLGCEVGGREVPVWAEATVDAAAMIASQRGDHAGIAAVNAAVESYVKALASPVGWVRRNALVVIGTDTAIDGVRRIVTS